MRFTLDEVLTLTGAQLIHWPRPDPEAEPLRLRPNHDPALIGPGDLFFPLRGWYPALLPELQRHGAAGLVLYQGQHRLPDFSRHPWLGAIALPEPLEGYLLLAAEARRRAAPLVVGVTGSSGKSSTKEYLARILARRYRVQATRASRNFLSDCAGVLLRLAAEPAQVAVIEMALGRLGDVAQMAALARPEAGVITSITREHIDLTGGDWLGVVREKEQLAIALPRGGLLVLHADDPGCCRVDRAHLRCQSLTFGRSTGADLQFGDVVSDEQGTRFWLRFRGEEHPVRLQAYGPHQAANGAAAALLARGLGLPFGEILPALAATEPPPRRFTIHRFASGLTLIDDTYSANRENTLAGLAHAARLARGRRQVALLAALSSLGDERDPVHREVGAAAVAAGFGQLLLLDSPGAGAMRDGALAAGLAPEQIRFITERERLVAAALAALGPDCLLYAKGSMYLQVGPLFDQLLQALPGVGFSPLERSDANG